MELLDKIKILKYPYHSKISKLILAIDYHRNSENKCCLLEKENKHNPFQVEHMVARMVEGGIISMVLTISVSTSSEILYFLKKI